MTIVELLKRLRDDLKTWAAVNLNALNAKINIINDRVGDDPVSAQISDAIAKQPHFSGDYNDLSNAPNIVEDETGNMTIADESGNIIFRVDADGAHTTALTLNGESIEDIINGRIPQTSHEHANKAKLDTYDKTQTELLAAAALAATEYTDGLAEVVQDNDTAMDTRVKVLEDKNSPTRTEWNEEIAGIDQALSALSQGIDQATTPLHNRITELENRGCPTADEFGAAMTEIDTRITELENADGGGAQPYIFTGTWSTTKDDNGDYPVTLGDDYSWTELRAAINANRSVGCIFRLANGNRPIFLTLSQNNYASRVTFIGFSDTLQIYRLSLIEDITNPTLRVLKVASTTDIEAAIADIVIPDAALITTWEEGD